MDKKHLLNKNNLTYEPIMFLNDSLVEKILNMMFLYDVNERKRVNIGYVEISLMNRMFIFLRNYKGENVSLDFYNTFKSELGDYPISYYIGFIFQYYKVHGDDYLFGLNFIKNIKDLYYKNDIEAIFNSKKFKLHYGVALTDTLSLEEDVNSELEGYVRNNLPPNLNELELCIAIYVLLAKVLRYSPMYTITENIYDTNAYFDVNLTNNEVVCVQFAIIYSKLLEKYGIDVNLAGDVHSHMYVNIAIGTLMLRADATKYGFYSDQLSLSDMTNLKYGFMIEGFFLVKNNYTDIDYIRYGNERIKESILSVYEKMGLRTDIQNGLLTYIDKYQKKEFDNNKKISEGTIEQRINEVNKLIVYDESNVESIQYFNMLLLSIFYDIAEDRLENISIYRKDDGKLKLSKLVVVYDEDNKPYYYLFTDGRLINYKIDDVVDIILRDGWCFKYQTDIDALYLDDEELCLKLMRE